MPGSKWGVVAVVVFAGGVTTAAIGLERYDAALGWVTHTSDVRLVLGRAVGHAAGSASCDGLRHDVGEFTLLTMDNPLQQQRVPAFRAAIDAACKTGPSSLGPLVAQLADLDATERDLMQERRARLAMTRARVDWSLAISAVVALAAIIFAFRLQRIAGRALRASEERFRLMAMAARDLLRIHDSQGRATYVSPSVEALLGYTAEEFLEHPPLSLGHPEDTERMRDALTAVQQGEASPSTLIYRLKRKDGAFRWFETHTSPVRDHDGRLLRFYTSGRDITERVELEKLLEAAAVTDELTGLLNRRGFMMLAQQQHRLAVRQRQGFAVIFADLDGLKALNDKLGHEYGDVAIKALGRILKETFRSSDVVARLGGDEFAAIAHVLDASGLDVLLERIRSAVAAAEPIGGHPLAVSLGAVCLDLDQKQTLDNLLSEADQRMYENKRARKRAATHEPVAAMVE